MTDYVVSSGLVSSGIVLGASDTETVLNGGVALATVVTSNALFYVSAGGVASNTTVDDTGGYIEVDGGKIVSTTFAGSGFLDVQQGGLATDTYLGPGATMLVEFGAVAIDTTIANSALLSNQFGTMSGTKINGGGLEYDGPGATTYGTIVESRGEQLDDFNAVTFSTVVQSGGYQILGSGAVANGTDIKSGGVLVVLPGGSAVGSIVDQGGRVQSGGVVELQGQTVVSAFVGASTGSTIEGLSTYVLSGGALIDPVVSYATVDVDENGTTSSADLIVGGSEVVHSGGLAEGTLVDWSAPGPAGYTQAGLLSVLSGGTAIGTVLESSSAGTQPDGTTDLFVASGAVVSGTVVSSGGVLSLNGGGLAEATQIYSGGEIDLLDISYDATGTVSLNSTTDLLTIKEGGQSNTLSLTGNYAHEYFHLGADDGSGTFITVNGTPCYCSGTRIRTDITDTAVEHLRIGDRLVTLNGELKPIRWIGRRSYGTAALLGNSEILPIKFAAGALGVNLPKRDLRVSPEHAMYLDGVLIPAIALVNGSSILQERNTAEVHYYHLELESHNVIFAEGSPSETYLDDRNRAMFLNYLEHSRLYPDSLNSSGGYCFPRVDSGPILKSIRQRIAGQKTPTRAGLISGIIDRVTRGRVTGWAIRSSAPRERQCVRVLVNGAIIGGAVADDYRMDLEEAGLGDGSCGFHFDFPGGLAPGHSYVIEVQDAQDGTALHCSPQIYEVTKISEEPAVSTPMTGRVDTATRDQVTGWAYDPRSPEEPVALQILNNGAPIASAIANGWRADLAQQGISPAWCGFQVLFLGGLSVLSKHVLEVRRESDGKALPGSPMIIWEANRFDETFEVAVAGAVDAIDGDYDRERVLNFLTAQVERVQQQQADADSSKSARLARAYVQRQRGIVPATATTLRALVIDPTYPDPSRDAGSVALLSHITALQRLGYNVSFVAADEIGVSNKALASAGVRCCCKPSYSSVEDVLRRQEGCCDVIYLHRIATASVYLAIARKYHPRARIVYSVADLHHIRLRRQADVQKRPELTAESRAVRLLECTATWLADAVVTHSDYEAKMLREIVPSASVYVVPWDVSVRPIANRFRRRHGVAFLGNFSHEPNIDAARFLIEQVMDIVWKDIPEMECILAGADVSESLAGLTHPKVIMVGHVADLSSLFERVRVTVAPLRFGAGLKSKVLDSFAAGVPCVMSSIAAEGFDLPDELSRLVGLEAATLASLIVELHEDPAANGEAARAGLAFIKNGFRPDMVKRSLQAAIEGDADAAMRRSA